MRRRARLLALAALLLAPASAARAQEDPGNESAPAAPPKDDERVPHPDEKTTPPPRNDFGETGEKEGFGQGAGTSPRTPRIRLEASFVDIFLQSRTRVGRTSASNMVFPHEDVHVPRWCEGERGSIVLKLHRYVAVGFEYVHVSAEGPREPVSKGIRFGGAPADVPLGARASGTVEIQQGNASLRFVAADSGEFRVEVGVGVAWLAYRFGIHPAPPLVAGPEGGFARGASRTVETYFAPTLGTFFCWNIGSSPFALFVDQYSGYFATRIGSLASYARAGIRIHPGEGLEVVVGLTLIAGNIFDIHDRWESRARGHRYRVADWTGGGPDVGLSFTF